MSQEKEFYKMMLLVKVGIGYFYFFYGFLVVLGYLDVYVQVIGDMMVWFGFRGLIFLFFYIFKGLLKEKG